MTSQQKSIDVKASGSRPAVVIVIVLVALLIPFLIVVGILAAIAIPAYQSYVLRAQVAEAIFATSEVRHALTANPALSREELLAMVRQAEDASRIIAQLKVSEPNSVLIRLSSDVPVLADKTLLLEAQWVDGVQQWACNQGSLPEHYRPSTCRF